MASGKSTLRKVLALEIFLALKGWLSLRLLVNGQDIMAGSALVGSALAVAALFIGVAHSIMIMTTSDQVLQVIFFTNSPPPFECVSGDGESPGSVGAYEQVLHARASDYVVRQGGHLEDVCAGDAHHAHGYGHERDADEYGNGHVSRS